MTVTKTWSNGWWVTDCDVCGWTEHFPSRGEAEDAANRHEEEHLEDQTPRT
jgi:hypothetical protein